MSSHDAGRQDEADPEGPYRSASSLAHEAWLRRDRALNIAAYILAAIGFVMLIVFTVMASRAGPG